MSGGCELEKIIVWAKFMLTHKLHSFRFDHIMVLLRGLIFKDILYSLPGILSDSVFFYG